MRRPVPSDQTSPRPPGTKPRDQCAPAAGHVSAERTAIVADKSGLAYPDRVAVTVKKLFLRHAVES